MSESSLLICFDREHGEKGGDEERGKRNGLMRITIGKRSASRMFAVNAREEPQSSHTERLSCAG